MVRRQVTCSQPVCFVFPVTLKSSEWQQSPEHNSSEIVEPEDLGERRLSAVVESDITECLAVNIQCGFPWWQRPLSQPSMAAQWWCGQAAGTLSPTRGLLADVFQVLLSHHHKPGEVVVVVVVVLVLVVKQGVPGAAILRQPGDSRVVAPEWLTGFGMDSCVAVNVGFAQCLEPHLRTRASWLISSS
ncbi:hypothetical protein E2C01_018989 [Portunus trituberculatus]|uniref:Uncharacterized protein n=1 Tax=Portunus trituberculatus TaxID=210409 RepID=A0A5B7DXZ2_PORTR|nr:hypothetical protein [Portunus trituberculatus]